MKIRHFQLLFCVILILCIASPVPGGGGYWELNLPVMDGATGVVEEKDEQFSTLSKSYEIEIKDPLKVRDFYDNFFESLGWHNTAKAFIRPEFKHLGNSTGWNHYNMDINSEGKPEANYVCIWDAQSLPAIGKLRLKLKDYADGIFISIVDVSISPELEMAPILMKLGELLSSDPKNLFELSQLVKGNPFEIENVNLDNIPENKLSDPVVTQYINIINETFEVYRACA
ncbi:hypothetical protein D1AOALGA4SA_1630 [Olavius algarvensis Delta 1 endosymbiont]|nr:hypothetical protein D1AOALGA4SA_1630 [Olavius algarvensis Delta 1 endosymbiont]